MLILFFVVVIIILLSVAFMLTGNSANGSSARYATEVAKAGALFSDLDHQIKFYYSGTETYAGFDNKFLLDNGFHLDKTDTGNMIEADWENWPVGLNSPYNGSFLFLGGVAGENIRIITKDIDNGNAVGIYILKKKGVNIDPNYTKLLEQSISKNFNFIGS